MIHTHIHTCTHTYMHTHKQEFSVREKIIIIIMFIMCCQVRYMVKQEVPNMQISFFADIVNKSLIIT